MPIKNLIILIFFFALNSCEKKKGTSENNSQVGDVVEVEYAKGFNIVKLKDGVILELLNPFGDIIDTITYQISASSSDQTDYSSENVISLPLESVVLMSSSYASFLGELDKTDIVKAISNKTYFYNNEIQRGLMDNLILELGYGQNIDVEKTIVLNPQLIVISGMSSSDFLNYTKVREAGIQIFPVTEWREEHPLGRAEWIKVFGVLTGKLEESIKIFNEVKMNYEKLTELVDGLEERPKVIVNAPYKDIWWLPGGKSYMSVLLKDAGAYYPWNENKETGGIQFDLEAVYYTAGDAEFWVNPGSLMSLKDMKGIDSRFQEFKAFREGNIYNNTLRSGDSGGNDYFETGIVRPDLILKDLIKIFHPDLISDHNFYFYKKLE